MNRQGCEWNSPTLSLCCDSLWSSGLDGGLCTGLVLLWCFIRNLNHTEQLQQSQQQLLQVGHVVSSVQHNKVNKSDQVLSDCFSPNRRWKRIRNTVSVFCVSAGTVCGCVSSTVPPALLLALQSFQLWASWPTNRGFLSTRWLNQVLRGRGDSLRKPGEYNSKMY